VPGFSAEASRTVPVAFAALFEAQDFESAVRLAISAGGDSDTIASMAGSLAEARWGIPEALEVEIWKVLPADMREVIERFPVRPPAALS
jgi:ADP-ribosylglycohydrolase